MEITYHLTKEDYFNFNLFQIKHSQAAAKALMQQRIVGPVIFLIFSFVFFQISGESFLGLFITFVILSILWVILYPKYFYHSMKRRIKKALSDGKYAGVTREHHLEINAEGLIESNAVSEMKINWSGIKEIKEIPDYFFIYNSTDSAFMIPKRDLQNTDDVRNHLQAKM